MSEPEPGLIRGYLEVLGRELPASIVDELADGLAGHRADHRVTVLAGSLTWVTALAKAGSMVRVAVCARALGPMLRPAMAR